ncbi:MAG: IS30 family transposase [Gammaproteobacteria bacterium]|jgi:IS30 family transposase
MLIAFFQARNATMKTYKQRCQIYALSKTGMSQNKIAKQLKVSQSTINRAFPVIQANEAIVLSKLKHRQTYDD